MAINTLSGTADGDSANRAAAHTSPSLQERTAQQVGSLLAIVNHLKDFTAQSPEAGQTLDVSAEVRKQADDTTCAAMHQLRNIVDDMSRWTSVMTPLEDAHAAMIRANVKLIDAQRNSVDASNRPSVRFQAPLVRTKDGYAAVLVETDEILGVGPTPDAALRDFDRNFVHLSDAAVKKLTRVTRELRRKARDLPDAAAT